MPIARFIGTTSKLATVAVVVASLALTGCAVAPTSQELMSTKDECSQFRAPFTQISNERQARIEKYAKVGAAGGAVVGGAVAQAAGENALAGMLVGALAGAALGATGGYLNDLQRRASSTAGLQRAVAGDASRDLQQTDRLVASMTSLNRCRLAQIQAVEKSVRAGGSRDAARAKINAIKQKVSVDNKAINAVVGDLTRTRNLYIGALRQTGADTESYVASIQRYTPRVTSPQRTSLDVNRGARPRTSNAVANLGYAEKELSAGAAAHADIINKEIKALNDLLI